MIPQSDPLAIPVPGADGRPALLLVGHGTKHQAGVEEYLALADRVRSLDPALLVGTGFIELSPPPISTAVSDLVAGGATEIMVIPLVLFDAGHAKTDVPASINLARAAHPGVSFTYGRALGVAPQLLQVVEDRLADLVPVEEQAETGVLLVGRGSSDPSANAELHRVARLLWEGRDFPYVEPAYVGLTGPRVPEGLERLARLGVKRIALVPYFLFTGVLEIRIRTQAEEFAAAHPDLKVGVTHYMGPDDQVAALALERYLEAVEGRVQRSCDTCVHRIQTVGFQDKLNSPLRPHEHPDDDVTHSHSHAPHDHAAQDEVNASAAAAADRRG